MRIKKFTQN